MSGYAGGQLGKRKEDSAAGVRAVYYMFESSRETGRPADLTRDYVRLASVTDRDVPIELNRLTRE